MPFAAAGGVSVEAALAAGFCHNRVFVLHSEIRTGNLFEKFGWTLRCEQAGAAVFHLSKWPLTLRPLLNLLKVRSVRPEGTTRSKIGQPSRSFGCFLLSDFCIHKGSTRFEKRSALHVDTRSDLCHPSHKPPSPGVLTSFVSAQPRRDLHFVLLPSHLESKQTTVQ